MISSAVMFASSASALAERAAFCMSSSAVSFVGYAMSMARLYPSAAAVCSCVMNVFSSMSRTFLGYITLPSSM